MSFGTASNREEKWERRGIVNREGEQRGASAKGRSHGEEGGKVEGKLLYTAGER
jgi:hypothetical protein